MENRTGLQLPEYDWGVEEWASYIKKHGWTQVERALVSFMRTQPYVSRMSTGAALFEARDTTGMPDHAGMMAMIWSLPDDVLDRLIASFSVGNDEITQT